MFRLPRFAFRLDLVLRHRSPSRPSGRRIAAAIQPLAAALLLAGCGGPLSTLDPLGPNAASIARLWWIMLAGSGVLFLLTMLVFAAVMTRPSWGARLGPRRWIVYGGLVLPGLVLPPLVGYSLWIGERVLAAEEPGATRIEAIGARWFWTFRYPDHGGAETMDVLHLPVGVPVEILTTSRDVIHSFWIPRLSGKQDAIPGQINRMRLRADAVAGAVEGQCAEFCGLGHAAMRFEVRLHPPEDLAAALAAEPLAEPPGAPGEAPEPEGLLPEPLR